MTLSPVCGRVLNGCRAKLRQSVSDFQQNPLSRNLTRRLATLSQACSPQCWYSTPQALANSSLPGRGSVRRAQTTDQAAPRARLRRLWNVAEQFHLSATAQNLKSSVRHLVQQQSLELRATWGSGGMFPPRMLVIVPCHYTSTIRRWPLPMRHRFSNEQSNFTRPFLQFFLLPCWDYFRPTFCNFVNSLQFCLNS